VRGQRPSLKALLPSRDGQRARRRNNIRQAAWDALTHEMDLPAIRALSGMPQLPLMLT
jgi:hypothetical protein